MNEELIALVISLRPDGIEPEGIPDFVQLITAAARLQIMKELSR